MAQDLKGKYFVKNKENGSFVDVTTLFDGVRVLTIDGMLSKGKPVNIYDEQWVNEQEEDFMITTLDNNNNPVVIRENVNIQITFVVRQKYATNVIDVQQQHDAFVEYLTGSDVWIKSSYVGNKYVHCVCLKEYKPTVTRLCRDSNSWMMGTIELHTLDAQTE